MNATDLAKYIDSLSLLPHQSAFALQVLKAEPPAAFSLRSPAGTGATSTAFAIVNAGVTCLGLHRVLHLSGHKALTMFSSATLKELSLSVPIVKVDRDYLIERELLAENDFWPEKGIFVVSLAEAELPRFERSFLDCSWDLVIIDEEGSAAFDGPYKLFLQKLVDSEPARLVALGRNPDRDELCKRLQDLKHSAVAKSRIILVSWYRNDSAETLLQQVELREVSWEIRNYSLTKEESEFFELLKATVTEIDSLANSTVRVAEPILKRAMSCLFSVENTLLRLEDKIDDNIPLSPRLGAIAEGYRSTKNYFDQCLEKLDTISGDSKSSALEEFLEETVGTKVCVISEFADTIKFLETRLLEVNGPAPLTLYAELTSKEVEQRMHILKTEHPALILTTDAALRGIELSPDIVVHYDIPCRPELLEFRNARFRRPFRPEPLRMVALVEEASVLKRLWEKQLQLARTLDE